MKNSRATAERMRPILQAMERSIESARRRRLTSGPEPAPPPAPPAAEQGDAPPRRKARPKRPLPEADYRAKAG